MAVDAGVDLGEDTSRVFVVFVAVVLPFSFSFLGDGLGGGGRITAG